MATEQTSDLRMKFIVSPSLGCLELAVKGAGERCVADVENVFNHVADVLKELFAASKATITELEQQQNLERALVIRVTTFCNPHAVANNVFTRTLLPWLESMKSPTRWLLC